jgi:tRNA (cmo5U34)-methyltransferase
MEKQIDFDGDWSNEYDDTAQQIIPAYHAIYELTHHLLRARLDTKARILVAGAGTGQEIIDCSQHNPHWSFTGFDPAEPMLSIAREKIAAARLTDRITLVQGLIDDVSETHVDAATAILTMHFLPDDGAKLDFLTGIADRLKPGAPLVLVDLEGDIGSDEYRTLSAAWMDQQLFKRGETDRVRKEFEIRESDVHFIPQQRIESLLAQAGFINIHSFLKPICLAGMWHQGFDADSFRVAVNSESA